MAEVKKHEPRSLPIGSGLSGLRKKPTLPIMTPPTPASELTEKEAGLALYFTV